MDRILVTLAGMFLLCAACQWIAWRVRLPAILFLLLTGVLVGPVLGLVRPDDLLGDLLFPFISLSVAVILFEGSLTLRFREIAGLEKVVRNLVSVGMLLSWIVTTLTTRFAVGLSWDVSLLFGAVTVVTGPTVIVPMLRTVRPTASVANILRWEGIVIDPIGASLAVLVYEFVISGGGGAAWGHTLLTLGQILLVGALLGAAGGYAFGLVLRRHWVPEYLQNLAALSLVVAAFSASNLLQPESGLVTVTVMGVWLANMRDVAIEDILDFKEHLSVLLISLLFIVLAARLEADTVLSLGVSALFVFLAIQFVARPVSVLVSTAGSRLTWPERHLLAWIAPRGIVAAAISALFAIELEKAGFPDAVHLVPLTFLVIVGTVLLQSTTARIIARGLGVAEPEPRGFLVIGANVVARAIAKALLGNGRRVLLADTSYRDISRAKMEDLDVYHGNPISEHADRHLDLVGIGRLLALSPYESVNTAAVMHYRMEFGATNVFSIRSRPAGRTPERLRVSARRRGRTLFGGDVTYDTLAAALAEGAEIRTTKLTKSFDREAFKRKYENQSIPLFAVDPKDRLHVFTEERRVRPGEGWAILHLAGAPSRDPRPVGASEKEVPPRSPGRRPRVEEESR